MSTRITFADICIIIALAPLAALDIADRALDELAAEHAEELAADPDATMVASIIDADPLFLAWDAVQRQRHGQSWARHVSGVDMLPAVEVTL